ncbi:hypothetical protein BCR35DRAFT_305536 [Leucosporidium creatinivorum]|uniref:Uncharacterized protein n=1 Tax=Leucosporidium creatinivorum TaxID=106004 RepID=A0A1Y2F061_9BASI|nr:hypothetical protein BCR35DRAFT_305536 [Leucosporidium creatinivorum]
MPFDPNKPNPSINREMVAPIPSEQKKHEKERTEDTSPSDGKGDWGPKPAGEQGVDEAAKEGGKLPGQPAGSPNTDENLIEAGTSTAGDGSADGGLNSGEGPDPKAKSKL